MSANESHSHTVTQSTHTGEVMTYGNSTHINGCFTRFDQSYYLLSSGSDQGPKQAYASFSLTTNISLSSKSIAHTHSLSGNTGGMSANADHSHTISSDGGTESRPMNITVKLWKRTA